MDAMSDISDSVFFRLSYFLEESSLLEAPLRAQNYLRNNNFFFFIEINSWDQYIWSVSLDSFSWLLLKIMNFSTFCRM